MGIKHATQTAKPDDPNYDVSADEWNEDHTIDDNSITTSKIINFGSQAVAAVEAEATLDLTGKLTAPQIVVTDGAGKYFQLPSMTAVQKIGLSAVNGMLVYDTTNTDVESYENGSWAAIGVRGVEQANPLNLTGTVTITAGERLTVDTIDEKTATAGVTVDSLLIKDGVIPDSAYPNAVLKDGTRAMTGNIQMGNNGIMFQYGGVDAVLVKTYGSSGLALRDPADTQYYHLRVGQMLMQSFLQFSGAQSYLYGHNYNFRTKTEADAWSDVLLVKKAVYGSGVNDQRVEIPRAGDITMLDDKMIDLGNETTGAAANATNRGKLRFVEGAAGARDRVYTCMKSDADAYSWVEIANGGA